MPELKIRKTDYIFLCTNIRARETRLLTRERVGRMTEAAGFDEAAALLTECDYPDFKGMSDDELEKALAAHRNQIEDEVTRFCPEPKLLEVFRCRYDYHNIKVLVKSYGEAGAVGRILSGSGLVRPDVMAECYRTEQYDPLPNEIRDTLREARALMERTGNPQRADFLVDREYYTHMLELTGKLSDGFYTDYVRLCIDAVNLRAAVRCLRLKQDASVLQAAMIPGGFVATYSITDAAAGGQNLPLLFSGGDLCKAAELGASALEEGTALTDFEAACESALTDFLAKTAQTGFGPAPVLAYLDRLDSDIVAIRTVLYGKRNGLSPESIKERLRESYV